MHSVVLNSLEEYLAGALNPARHNEIEAHLESCAGCREEVRSMQDISELFGSMRSEEVITPSPAFYAKVMRQVEVERPQPGFWSLFGFDFAFGRRLALASLLALAVMGTYLVSTESEIQAGPTPMSVMMAQDQPGDGAPDRDNMLVTLATYEP